MVENLDIKTVDQLKRIADALEVMATPACNQRALLRQAGDVLRPGDAPQTARADSRCHAYVWDPAMGQIIPLTQVSHLPPDLLLGIDRPKAILLENTRRFAAGLPANNALLWGARGMGKSSLIKSIHAHVSSAHQQPADVTTRVSASTPLKTLELIEISRTDLATLGQLNRILATREAQCLIYCDDLSFDYDDGAYKSLKTLLDGGLAGCPGNVLFYATSNRRHLMPRDMMDNEAGSAINPGEAVEEKLSLSDRFGLWLGFHKCDQETYLNMIAAYVEHYGLDLPDQNWRAAALEWQVTRGARSGRVAWQFFKDLAGQEGFIL